MFQESRNYVLTLAFHCLKNEVGLFFVRPDRYVPLFGEFFYDFNKWRGGVPFEEQLKALQEVIDEGKVWIYGFIIRSMRFPVYL